MPLYHAQDEDEELWIAARDYGDAVNKWTATKERVRVPLTVADQLPCGPLEPGCRKRR